MAKSKKDPQTLLNLAVSIISIPLFLVIWELAARAEGSNMVLFPPPTIVARGMVRWVESGDFFLDLWTSLRRVVVGFLLGASVGVVMGVLTGRVRLISSLLSPIFHILRPIPPIAFIPIVILWFGLSETGKLFLIFWGVFFMVWISTHLAVQNVDKGLIKAALALGTPERLMLREVIFLGALPVIMVGLRTSVGISFYTLVAAELAGTVAGVFFRIDIAQQNLQTGQVLGGLLVLGLLSFLADRAFGAFANRAVWWR